MFMLLPLDHREFLGSVVVALVLLLVDMERHIFGNPFVPLDYYYSSIPGNRSYGIGLI